MSRMQVVNIVERLRHGLLYLRIMFSSGFRLLTEDPNERLGAKGAAEVFLFLVFNFIIQRSFVFFILQSVGHSIEFCFVLSLKP